MRQHPQPGSDRLWRPLPPLPGAAGWPLPGGVGLLARGHAGAFDGRPVMAGGAVTQESREWSAALSAALGAPTYRWCATVPGRRRGPRRWVRLIRDRRRRHGIFGYGWPVAGSALHCSSSSAHCGRSNGPFDWPLTGGREVGRARPNEMGAAADPTSSQYSGQARRCHRGLPMIAVRYCCVAARPAGVSWMVRGSWSWRQGRRRSCAAGRCGSGTPCAARRTPSPLGSVACR